MSTEIRLWLFRLAGGGCLGLITAHFVAATRLSYVRSLEHADVIVRQIFYAHCGYIVFLIVGFAVLCLAKYLDSGF